MRNFNVFVSLLKSTLLPISLLAGLLEAFQPNYFLLKMLYTLLSGVLIVVPLCFFALLFIRNGKLKWWLLLLHFLSSVLITTLLSVMVLIGVYYLPHGKWQKTSPAPASIARIEVLPNSIEPGILTVSGDYFVYDCQADEGSKITCAWLVETGENQAQTSAENDTTLKPYRFFAPMLLRKPVETVLSARYFADAIDTARFVRFDDQVVHYWVRIWNSYAIFIRGAFALLIGLVATISISISLAASMKKSGSMQRPEAGTEGEA